MMNQTTNDQLTERLQSRKFRQNYAPPTEDIIFQIQGKNIGTLQSFVVFSGLPKQGKSLFITSAIASAFTTWDIFGMKINFPADRKRLCYIDTESSDFDYYRVLERIKIQMIEDQMPYNFDSFLFREDAPKDIMQMIEIYLQQNPDCSILVLDGILDLISDFNNVEQSFYLVQWLKKITKKNNLLILCVLHLGKKDQNSIGHIGSYLDRKAQSVLKIEKNKEQRTIDMTSVFLRSTDEIEPISIQFQQDRWVQIKTDTKETNDQMVFGMEKAQLLFRILPEPRTYSEILSFLCEFSGKGLTTCKKILRQWIQQGDIYKEGEKYKRK